MDSLKSSVKNFWEQETCGTRYGESADRRDFYQETAEARYQLEPYIPAFAGFEGPDPGRILEIGVGGGADFHRWLKAGKQPVGIDLTLAGVNHTKARLEAFGESPARYSLLTADAEQLPFKSDHFDLVYSWGVLHHSPDTPAGFSEAFRVLKPGGQLRAMIYHSPSWTGFMLWVRYGLMKGNPRLTEKEAVFQHLESPGTKIYTRTDARFMLRGIGFSDIRLSTRLASGDTLSIKPSKKYQGFFYSLIWKYYPRWLVRALGNRFGLFLCIQARKPIA